VPSGNDSGVRFAIPNSTFWFAAGTHTLGTGQYDSIIPADNDIFIGAPGAVIDGQGDNSYAFEGPATGVTIEYLTIQNFDPPGNQGAVNSSASALWTIEHDTVQDNTPGTGMYIGTDDIVKYNCLTKNGQAAFGTSTSQDTSPLTHGPSNITISDNEISRNDTYNWEKRDPGCGCSGGGKFWETDGAFVEDNYIHNNYNDGLWMDTNNVGFDISGNWISDNAGEGLIYEIGYNASITDNTFVNNAWDGAENGGFPDGAIYVSESGGDSLVTGRYSGKFLIEGNVFTNNWSGVVLWESSDRFCGNPDVSNSLTCVLTKRSIYYFNGSATAPGGCGQNSLQRARPFTDTGKPSADYYDGCRWTTQYVTVEDNIFNFDPADIPGCLGVTNSCGENALFSEYGTFPSWSPYKGDVVEQAITHAQHNLFEDNTYTGPWNFMYHDQSRIWSFARWHASGQDRRSTFNKSRSGR